MISRLPRPELRPFIARLWASDGERVVRTAERERVVPTGALHLAIRLDDPLVIYDPPDGAARVVGHAVIGGARAAPYIRDVSRPGRSVGAQLRAGAAALLGASGAALAGRHTRLDELWGSAADELRDELLELGDPVRRLDRFEAALLARLPRVRGVHPAVAHALGQLAGASDVATVVEEIGYSHRRFIALFRDAVGLTPKLYGRVQRIQRAIALAGAARGSLAAIAAGAGYSDQAHFTREFRALVGVSPGEYRALAPAGGNHVPLARRR